eukprot:3544351-Rhodomonas_salina.1
MTCQAHNKTRAGCQRMRVHRHRRQGGGGRQRESRREHRRRCPALTMSAGVGVQVRCAVQECQWFKSVWCWRWSVSRRCGVGCGFEEETEHTSSLVSPASRSFSRTSNTSASKHPSSIFATPAPPNTPHLSSPRPPVPSNVPRRGATWWRGPLYRPTWVGGQARRLWHPTSRPRVWQPL